MLTEEQILNKPISYSGMKKILKSPYHYLMAQQKGYESTPDTIFGDAVHTMLLEPDKFYNKFIVIDKNERPEPEKTMASKANKEWKKELEEKAVSERKDIIDNFDLAKLKKMVEVAKVSFDKYIEFATDIEKDISGNLIYTNSFGTTLTQSSRGRIDISSDKTYIADYKTTQDASESEFARSCAKYMYHLQGAVYMDLENVDTFVFLVQEKEAPYLCSVYLMNRDSPEYRKGVELYQKACKILDECKQKGTLKIGYEDINNKTLAKTLSMPKWALN